MLSAPSASAAEYRLGVVNPIKVLESAPQAEDARKRLEKEFAPRDRKLVASQKALKDREDRLARDGPIMSEAERQRLEREVRAASRELKRDQDEFREDLNLRRNEEFTKIQRLVVEAIQAVAKDKEYDLIVGEGVIYASERVDMTDEIIQRLKRDYKGRDL
jgi:outer membrane protein